ncbi:CBS domain-containing protein [Nitrosomonas supralitoralis]|uniref:CBS domain-containing protein n=1 Tax=Nitrosomonas supralitoralis TaxID=2116706 RepID=A0A2P7NRC3_9PROT|nr:CBS domain-containing protein [Nitrosomonas supralitoralis]PSJ16010.1 CBS domain-containing protein [Nitrosomonas supralitoralis]
MLVSEFMDTNLITIKFDDKLSVVKAIFEKSEIHYAIVVEDKKVFAVVSDRDLYMALSPNVGTVTETLKDVATLNKRVHQIATRDPVVLKSDAPIAAAIGIFSEMPISYIPIVNDRMEPLGIISARNVFKVILALMQTTTK